MLTTEAGLEHGTETAYRHHGCRCEACRAGRAERARTARARRRAPRAARHVLPHGTVSGYSYHKCRCDECRTAYVAYRRDLRAKGVPTDGTIAHGTLAGYDRACRCDACRHAKSTYMAEWRKRKGRTTRSNTLDTIRATRPALSVSDVLTARAQALALTIARAPRSAAALEARHRRAEVLGLLAHLDGTDA